MLNVDRTLVSQWERGVCEPSLECLAEICRILNISSDDFLEINNNEAEEIIKINECALIYCYILQKYIKNTKKTD